MPVGKSASIPIGQSVHPSVSEGTLRILSDVPTHHFGICLAFILLAITVWALFNVRQRIKY